MAYKHTKTLTLAAAFIFGASLPSGAAGQAHKKSTQKITQTAANQRLLRAVETGNLAAARAALAAGADPNARSENDMTALLIASRRADAPMMNALLDAGADVNAQGVRGYTALTILPDRTNITLIHSLLDRGADLSHKTEDGVLPLADYAGRPDVLRLFLSRGAKVNARNSDGSTALMYASRLYQKPDVLQLLLSKGADIHAKDAHGGTALTYAAYGWYNVHIMQFLLDQGADVSSINIPLFSRSAPLVDAVVNGDTAKVDFLVSHGADVNDAGHKGLSALQMVLLMSNPYTDKGPRLLLDRGADVNSSTGFGGTPLIDAAMYGETARVKMLLSYKADVNRKNDLGYTALKYARQADHQDVAALLEAAGEKE